jgi:hypothetical protein
MSKNAFTVTLDDGRKLTLDEKNGTLVVRAKDGTLIENRKDGPLGRLSKNGVGRRYDELTDCGRRIVG